MRQLTDSKANETVDISTSDSIDQVKDDEFVQGAMWALRKLADWLEKTPIVADDKASQHAVDQMRMLIAEQARQAATHVRSNR